MDRRETNLKILELLHNIVEKNPDLRFGQILFNYVLSTCCSEQGKPHVDDPFYEESIMTFNRIKLKYDTNRSN